MAGGFLFEGCVDRFILGFIVLMLCLFVCISEGLLLGESDKAEEGLELVLPNRFGKDRNEGGGDR